MKRLTKYVIGIILVVAILGSAAVAFASEGESDGPRKGPKRGRGPGGEVTAITDNSLTIRTPKDETLTVNVSDETKIILVESQSEGSLSDIEVGDMVGVHGRKNDEGSVEARGILVLPDGDRAGGKVTAVDGESISVENRQGSATIITTDDTKFRVGREEGSLSDVAEGGFVMAFGEAQDDGSLIARLVMTKPKGQHPGGPGGPDGPGGPGGPGKHGKKGEVAAIDGTTFTLN